MKGNGTILIDRIKDLLGSGLTPATIAVSLGCDASYITQLLSDDQFRAAVQDLKFKNLRAAALRDEELDNLEDVLLSKLKTALPMMVQPALLLKSFQVINGAKRRATPVQEQTIIHNNIVNLEFPTATSVQFRSNPKNEIIEVEGRPLATLPSNIVASMAANLQENQNRNLDHVQSSSNPTLSREVSA